MYGIRLITNKKYHSYFKLQFFHDSQAQEFPYDILNLKDNYIFTVPS